MSTFLLDHCVWHPTAQALHQAGTRDADFTDLTRYPLGRHWGIIYLRITPPTTEDVHRTLLLALREIAPADLRGSLLTVEPDDYRLRRPT